MANHDIEEVREVFSRIEKNVKWFQRRGLTFPYEWDDYIQRDWVKLLNLLKIEHGGALKRKDKRGNWRVMKEKEEDTTK